MAGEAGKGRAPALLLNRTGYGTLAAARCLGRAGVPVTLTGASRLTPLRWSRFVTGETDSEPAGDLDGKMRWLLGFGRTHPGHVLLPEDDTWLWWMATHGDELAVDFQHALPPAGAVYGLLDKRLLGESARSAGLKTPETWAPESDEGLRSLVSTMEFPVVIKPRTPVGLGDWKKGEIVHRAEEFAAAYRTLRLRAHFGRQVLAYSAMAAWPIVQRYHPLTRQGVYNVSGFIDRSGELFVAQANWKLIQRPRHLGIGVAFEAAPLDGVVAKGLRALCRRVGFHGIFEAEFLPVDGRKLLIDFNPRHFHGIGLTIARGAPLPLLAYLDATGDTDALKAAIGAIPPDESTLNMALCFGRELSIMLRAQRLTGGLTGAEARAWRRWRQDHAGRLVDAVRDPGDPWPACVDTAGFFWRAIRYPRTFAGTYVLNR